MSGRLSNWSAAEVAARLSKSGKGRSRPSGDGWIAPCPAHDDQTPSLSLRNTPEGKLLWYCFGGCESDDVRKAVMAVLGGEPPPEKENDEPRVRERVEDPRVTVTPVPDTARITMDTFQHQTYGMPTKIWTYRTEAGEPYGWIARYDMADGGKEIIPFVWTRHAQTGREEARMRAMPEPRPIYNLNRIAAEPEATVVMVEGEKAVDAAAKLFPGWIATTIAGGGNAVRLADLSGLARRMVVIMADHDGPGYEFAMKIANQLPVSADVRMMLWPDRWPTSAGGAPYMMAKGDDAADHFSAGWTREMLKEVGAETGVQLVHRVKFLNDPFEVIHYASGKPS